MSIAQKLIELRQKKKMTQKELAEQLNVSDKVISRWETGKSLPDVLMMKKISEVLEVSISELYDCVEGTNEPKEETEYRYDTDRIWKYVKYSIVSYVLLIISLLIVLLANWMKDEGNLQNSYILLLLAVITTILSISIEVIGYLGLYHHMKTRDYKEEYLRVMKKHSTICAVLCVISLFLAVMFYVVI
ncbi:MAG: helix-turn-helix domain-containing protein [Anaeroplasmataceae bacterium]|nr:helix-turn-helix domain-containing protein [Anaeroplasmataceae bacterium]